jgi:uncharacterized zinc-type alcohol dehydrogenase-like protein
MMPTKGYAAARSKAPLAPHSFERRNPREHDVVIDIRFCGVCHSDIHQARDEWGGSIFPMVPGHEVAGVVSRVGAAVTKYKVGDAVGVGCYVDSCRKCSYCKAGLQQYCLEGPTPTYNGIERDGKTPTYGGYSTQVIVDENYVLRMPSGIPLESAAPLLCAGITLYSPLMHWKAGPGKKVAVVGLGGLGHMGVKIAHALGAEVTVLSQSLKKRDDGIRMGADHFYASDAEAFANLQDQFDLIMNTVSSDVDWSQYFKLLKLDGTMVMVGLPEKKMTVDPFALTARRRSLAGSMIGGIQETQEMLDFCGKHQLGCDIEMISIQKINQAYERVLQSDVRYRFVIDIASLK